MKRWLGVLICLLMLCGCSKTAPQTPTLESTNPTITFPTVPTESLYDPQNPLEVASGGAVKVYNLNGLDCGDIAAMGENYLLFGQDTLTLLEGEGLSVVRTVTLEGLPVPDSGMIQIRPEGVGYYNAVDRTVVFLSERLRQTGVLQLTDEVTGGAYLTPDWKRLYYCTEEGVQVLDMETGVSRLLKAQTAAKQSICGGFLQGQVLRCRLEQDSGAVEWILVCAQTGRTLGRGDYLQNLIESGQGFYLHRDSEWFVGQGAGQPHNFYPREPEKVLSGQVALTPLPEDHSIVTASVSEMGMVLDYYDLTSGLRSGSVILPDVQEAQVYTAGNGAVWLRNGDALYRWAPALSPVEDETVYTEPRYSLEDPDEEGLAVYEAWAQELEQRYGVNIQFWQEPGQHVPVGYSFELEYLTEPYEAGFAALEKVLSQFPEDFFQKAVDWTQTGQLQILLVRSISADPSMGEPAVITGLQYHLTDGAYIVLAIDDSLEQSFYHQTGCLIETRILSQCTAYYEWNELNPYGFRYDNDYVKNQQRSDKKYLEGKNRYFISKRSMAFAFEDRASILEYACMPGNESVFASQYMQAKLRRICAGIREAFSLPEEAYIWEQYLT